MGKELVDMDRYTYSPLAEENEEIRLLKLLPGRRGSPCHGSLVRESLRSSRPEYAALSYTWGAPDKSRSLVLPGDRDECYTLPITQNLYDALNHLRDEDEPRNLWVDAICIDQENITERSQQVRRMWNIFQSASKIIVWLGLASNNSDLAIQQIRELSNRDWENDLPSVTVRERQDMTSVLQRPWFYRAWVRQEVAASKPEKCVVKCGDAECLFDDMKRFLLKLQSHAHTGKTAIACGVDEWTILAETARVARFLISSIPALGSRQSSMEFVLHSSRYTQATDSRDHVFAMWNLTLFAQDADQMIDYSNDAAWVFASTVKHSIIRTGSLSCLKWILHHKPPGDPEAFIKVVGWDPPPDLPSWVPDWSHAGYASRVPLSPGLFRASGGSRADYRMLDNMREIQLSGLEIGEIQEIAACSLADALSTFFTTKKVCIERYGTALDVFEAVWRAQLADTLISVTETGATKRWPKGIEGSELFWRCTRGLRSMDGVSQQPEDSLLIKETWTIDRKMAVSLQGYVCLVPKETEVGDHICVFAGGEVPFIIRAFDDKEQAFFVGEAYVHGIMDGEAWDPSKLQYATLA